MSPPECKEQNGTVTKYSSPEMMIKLKRKDLKIEGQTLILIKKQWSYRSRKHRKTDFFLSRVSRGRVGW